MGYKFIYERSSLILVLFTATLPTSNGLFSCIPNGSACMSKLRKRGPQTSDCWMRTMSLGVWELLAPAAPQPVWPGSASRDRKIKGDFSPCKSPFLQANFLPLSSSPSNCSVLHVHGDIRGTSLLLFLNGWNEGKNPSVLLWKYMDRSHSECSAC